MLERRPIDAPGAEQSGISTEIGRRPRRTRRVVGDAELLDPE
ncbi:hypothetical protein [Halobellus limi]|nr:hypothetical protein [Halobellus limi]